MLKEIVRVKTAPGHCSIGDAHGGGVTKLHSYVEIIIFFEKAIVNDTENVKLVRHPILVGKLHGKLLKLLGKAASAGHAKGVLYGGCNG